MDQFTRTIQRRVEFGEVEERPEGEQEVERKRLESQYLTTFVQGHVSDGFGQRLLIAYPLLFEVVTARIS